MKNLLWLMMFACGTEKQEDDDVSTEEQEEQEEQNGTETENEVVCEQPEEVSCVDQLLLDLSLQGDKVSEGAVTNETDGNDFVTYVDATAGGFQSASSNPWVYIKFTANGAEKVEIDDETALESMDWDLSLRRYLLRLNGGSSGPSCVGSATFLEQSYESLSEVPEGLTFATDDYYTPDCTLISDAFGMGPQVVLGSWWDYPGCVATTMYPHLIQLADGSVIKMVVEAYYSSDQDVCNESGSGGSGSANITLRWSFL